ncbi:predicted protein [Naegleria gruberi]|uniref:Predicted protein n=1 Tax=Naegleria gruberi TaxID=5762 RepID=D2VMH2_NAEGR|nr:uncharacterized protein NAEGRDRAFT_70135 [Naegleria gruberi]EFC41991.1 predicted protein [Naegleria gruberi]|eukprot:XP_002674735.1 predicted protein [Naegleria gruberi strain NEG-M]
MKIGYVGMNRALKLTTSNTTRLNNVSPKKIKEKLLVNIDHLKKMLKWNVQKNLLFFRIGSEFVPFASHEKVRDEEFKQEFNWIEECEDDLKEIGKFVKENNIRISMHPDQFVLINSPDMEIFNRSYEELNYHAQLMNTMGLDTTHKFQIHLGGKYDDKRKSMQRFVDRYKNNLNDAIRARCVLENDDRIYSLEDVYWIHQQCGIPILFDTLHHECLNSNGDSLEVAFKKAASTWDPVKDGVPLIDYSDQEPGARIGNHRKSIELKHFKKVICDKLMKCKNDDGEFIEFDVMLEIKDKDASAIKILPVFLKGVEDREKDPEPTEDDNQEDLKVQVLEEDEDEAVSSEEEKPKKRKKAPTKKASTTKRKKK